MRRHDETPGVLRAAVVGVLLFGISMALLSFADEALDVAAVAGGIGVVMSGALLGLALLVARWRHETPGAGYTATSMSVDEERSALSTLIAQAFDDPAAESPADDAAAI